MITAFVMVMMLIIEFFNVKSKGSWSKVLQKSKWSQLLLAALLGITPGCLGTYTIVSLYTHNIVNFGALVTVLIATSGDEAFVMFSMIPDTALKLTAILFVIAIVVGFIVNIFYKGKRLLVPVHFEFPIHEEEEEKCVTVEERSFYKKFKGMSFQRAILIFGLCLSIVGVIVIGTGHDHSGQFKKGELDLPHEIIIDGTDSHESSLLINHEHENESEEGKWNWINITFLIATLCALAIVITSGDHFLDHHLWDHIIKKHFLKIFLWTFGALIFIHFLMDILHLEEWLISNQFIILIAAVLIGLIPESGPHLIFVTMFFEGTIPFSTLLASSIVQDGHGALPLFAESKKSFIYAKLINLIVGFIIGMTGFWTGF